MNKKAVIKLVKDFGLEIDYDQWYEEGWLRVVASDHADHYGIQLIDVLILRESDTRDNILYGLQHFLIEIGQFVKESRIRHELGIKIN